MKRFIALIAFIALIPVVAYGFFGIHQAGMGRVPAAGGYTCVGWPSSGCVPTGTPVTEPASTVDRTYTRAWTATENGTAISINIYIPAWTPDAGHYRLYKQAGGSGDSVLIGHTTVTGSITEDTWNKITLSAFGAQNLNFASGDILYFGVAWEEEGATASSVGRNDEAGSLFFVTTAVSASGPDPIATWTETGTRNMAIILEYDPA